MNFVVLCIGTFITVDALKFILTILYLWLPRNVTDRTFYEQKRPFVGRLHATVLRAAAVSGRHVSTQSHHVGTTSSHVAVRPAGDNDSQ